jgi:thiosulfate/3-mercaptopyruvate sulfurtransferase
MTGSITLVLALVLVLVAGVGAQANSSREIEAIVSTEWLADNLDTPNLVILDVRNPDEYVAGHIPGAVNSPEWLWYVSYPFVDPHPWMELPAVEDLFATIGSAGISGDSLVVIVSRTVDSEAGPAVYALAGATRVAATLIYAGVENVAILDGGHDKWLAEGRSVSTDVIEPMPVTYEGEVNEAMFVSRDYVATKMRGLIIVDARDADVYFGVTLEPWATAGHIPGAGCLPAPWLWNAGEGYCTYKDTAVLKDMATGVVGKSFTPREIVVYCGVGGYASTDYFVLSEVLGYQNVKIYDGSAQEWTADPEAPLNLYMWE